MIFNGVYIKCFYYKFVLTYTVLYVLLKPYIVTYSDSYTSPDWLNQQSLTALFTV